MLNPPPTITISIEGQLPTFKTHPTPLEQVFRNLIGNAVKHHPGPQGRIVVSCQEQGDRYVFAVADDGEGIPAQYAERVFEMFQTLKPRDQVEGSGMGLAIVNRIVQWQGGRVWFEPAPAGRGTVFKFQWKKNQPLAANVETQGMRSSKVVTILLVEDDEVDVKALRWAFDKLKIANPLVIARDGVEALEMLQELPRPYLIITDINMPRMNGIELLAQDPGERRSFATRSYSC